MQPHEQYKAILETIPLVPVELDPITDRALFREKLSALDEYIEQHGEELLEKLRAIDYIDIPFGLRSLAESSLEAVVENVDSEERRKEQPGNMNYNSHIAPRRPRLKTRTDNIIQFNVSAIGILDELKKTEE